MKVLIVANIPSPYRVDFFNEFGKYCNLTVAFEGHFATDRSREWKYGELRNFSPVFLKGLRIKSDRFLCPGIIRLLKQEWDWIIICGYSSPTMILAIEYLKINKKPFLLEVDGGFIKKESRFLYRIKRHLITAARGIFSTGDETTKYLVHYGADIKNCYKYPFTSLTNKDIEKADELIKQKKDLKIELKISDNFIILAVGQFIYRKGFDILISASNLIRSKCDIYIIGGEPLDEYKRMIKLNNIKNIKFIKFKSKEELKKYYAIADLFILPTRNDIWGLVINEAMCFSLPVITTNRCIAGLELVKNGYNGCIVESDDHKDLAKAINYIIDNKYGYEFGKRNRDKIKTYTIEEMVKVHINIINRINNNAND